MEWNVEQLKKKYNKGIAGITILMWTCIHTQLDMMAGVSA